MALTASSPHVAAYLRRSGDHAVLVVANLDAAPVSGVAIASAPGVLPPGRYTTRNLLRRTSSASLRVGPDGRITSYVPRSRLDSRESLVLDLTRAGQ